MWAWWLLFVIDESDRKKKTLKIEKWFRWGKYIKNTLKCK